MDRITKILGTISGLFLTWVMFSWIEVVLKNVDGESLNSVNFFVVMLDIF